jgi:uncharacterized membrane protein YgaE (UPF0421/DUF939 family)
MAVKNNKKCIICGTAYSYCPSCSRDMDKPSWYTLFHSDNCNNIYNIVTGYRDGLLTIAEAKTRLKTLDLSKIDDEGFNAKTREQIKKILSYNDAQYETESAVNETEDVETEEVPRETESAQENKEEPVVQDVVKPEVNKNYENKHNNKHFHNKNR